ncbi:MAG: hypothetical protein J0653_07350, partial [Deltaproteobacteria bacterium]|nr:hypothetical protein [Deltaproteobacteria bacterium]
GDPISAFVDECIEFVDDEKALAQSKDIWNAFKTYCTGEDINLSKWGTGGTTFYRKLNDDFEMVAKSNPAAKLAAEPTVLLTRDRKKARFYRG